MAAHAQDQILEIREKTCARFPGARVMDGGNDGSN